MVTTRLYCSYSHIGYDRFCCMPAIIVEGSKMSRETWAISSIQSAECQRWFHELAQRIPKFKNNRREAEQQDVAMGPAGVRYKM